jgi:hypothetical protein
MISVSTDKNKLEVSFIQHFLKDIYWAAGRTVESNNYWQLFLFWDLSDEHQIGFARVITDYVVFAYVMDVFYRES